MKKKIKDLTITEVRRICDNNNRCPNCPLFSTEIDILCILSEFPILIPSTYWEYEVEIPDEVFGKTEQAEEENG